MCYPYYILSRAPREEALRRKKEKLIIFLYTTNGRVVPRLPHNPQTKSPI